jgi:hypothetical protein
VEKLNSRFDSLAGTPLIVYRKSGYVQVEKQAVESSNPDLPLRPSHAMASSDQL